MRFSTMLYLSLIVTVGWALPDQAMTLSNSAEKPFLDENRIAMDRMMTGMDISPSGDTDKDFADMMKAHHQGAIDMAVAELRYGRNVQLRRIAQEIVVEQQLEIAAMARAVGERLPASKAAVTQPACLPSKPVVSDMRTSTDTMSGMIMNKP